MPSELSPRQVRPRFALVLVALAVAVAIVPVFTPSRLGYRRDTEARIVVPVPPGTERIVVEIDEGAVSFEAGAPGVVVVETLTRWVADTAEGLARLEELEPGLHPVTAPGAQRGVLLLRGAAPPPDLDPAAHHVITKCIVQVPPAIAIEAHTAHGPVAAQQHRAPIRLETGRGDVRLHDCHGPAIVRARGEGGVIVDGHRGNLDIERGQCQTMQVFLDELGPGGVRLVTQHGGIQLHLPAGMGFELRARTQAGRAKNGFGIPVERLPGTKYGHLMTGTANGGGPLVELVARKTGNISVDARPAP